MPDFNSLFSFAIASVALLVIPGPAVIYIVNRSVANGRSIGLASVLGLELGTFMHVLAATVGLSAILATSENAFNIVKWHSAMESKRISIEYKVPGAYHESQYIMDYLDASLTVEVKSFKAEVNIIRNRYLRGNPDGWNASYIAGEIIKTYNNMFEDGTWNREIGEKDQIFALTTKLTEMQAKFDKQIASFATQLHSKRIRKILLLKLTHAVLRKNITQWKLGV